MRRIALSLLALFILAACASVPDTADMTAAVDVAKVADEPTADLAAQDPFKEISIEQLSTLIKDASPITILDVNGDNTRAEFGVIPGAKLLSGYDTYSTDDLPEAKDAALVFYCSTQKCLAAPKAASKACEAGYTDVHVLRAGIKGWVAANQSIEGKTTPE